LMVVWQQTIQYVLIFFLLTRPDLITWACMFIMLTLVGLDHFSAPRPLLLFHFLSFFFNLISF
jgi:hypothetical protein